MIEFNHLELVAGGRTVSFDISVSHLQRDNGEYYFKDMYISDIFAWNQNTYGNEAKAVSLYHTQLKDVRRVSRVVDIADLMKDTQIIFIKVLLGGNTPTDLPCGFKGRTVMGVAYDRCALYDKTVNLLNGLEGCEPDTKFMHNLLQIRAFEAAIKTGNFDKAIEWWNKFFNTTKQTKKNCAASSPTPTTHSVAPPPVKSCGCHGR